MSTRPMGKVFIFLIICLYHPPSFSSWRSTTNYINSLLENGKKVAILLIDMQQAFGPAFNQYGNENRIDDMEMLLMRFAKNPDVLFVDINVKPPSVDPKRLLTLPDLLSQLKRKEYRRFFKHADNAFEEPADVSGYEGVKGIIEGDLGNHLKSMGVTDLVPTGCYDGVCIQKTTEGALKEDFEVHVDRDLNIFYSDDMYGGKGFTPNEVRQKNDEIWMVLKEEYPQLSFIKDSNSSGSCSPEPTVRIYFMEAG